MAYFPNGTSFAHWVAENCDECLNYRDNGTGSFGCAIADAHFIFDYDEGAVILDSLIPREGPDQHKCAMRLTQAMLETEERERNHQLDLERYEAAMAEARAA